MFLTKTLDITVHDKIDFLYQTFLILLHMYLIGLKLRRTKIFVTIINFRHFRLTKNFCIGKFRIISKNLGNGRLIDHLR